MHNSIHNGKLALHSCTKIWHTCYDISSFNNLQQVSRSVTSNSKHINTSIWLTWIGKCERSSEEKMKIDEERNLVRRHERVRNSATTSSRYSTWSQRKTRRNSPNFSNSIDGCQTCRWKLTTIQYNFLMTCYMMLTVNYLHAVYVTDISCRWWTCAKRYVMPNMLQTKVDAQCNKLVITLVTVDVFELFVEYRQF